MTILTWILTVLSIIGAILNARKRVEGFYFWLVANAGWILIAYEKELYAQIPLWAIYSAISIIGIREWRKK